MPVRLLRLTGIVLVLLLLTAASAAAAPRLDGEFEVSSLDTNTKIAAGPDGNVWVTLAFNELGKDVAKITPGGQVEEFDLSANEPSGIAAGPEGRMWITRNGGVTSFDPAHPEETAVPTIVEPLAGNSPIVTGPDGNLWAATTNTLVKIPPGAPESSEKFTVAELSPRDIDVAGPLLVIADFSAQHRIVTATTAGTTNDLPIAGGAQGVAGSPDGQIAFSDQGASPEQAGLITPPNPAQEFELLGDPFGVAFGGDGAFWIAQAGPPEQLTRVTTDGQTSSLGGFAPGFKPRQITAGPGNTLWVTLENPEFEGIDRVARISGVEQPKVENPPSPPDTKIGRAPKKKTKTRRKRAKIKFRFSSPTPGATFECALSRLKKGSKPPRPRFGSCRSPKVYRLAPGRYRFMVRAVASGLADPTPAKRFFRVVRKH